MRFRQAIHIEGRNVGDILALPCVMGCTKTSAVGEPLQVVYTLFGDTIAPRIRWGATATAGQGDWLCEDYHGRWHALSDKDYQEMVVGWDPGIGAKVKRAYHIRTYPATISVNPIFNK